MTKKIQMLYLLQSGELYKIGISNDVNSRIKGLQTGSGYEVKCIAYYKTKEPARTVEKRLHKLFDKYRKKGEWFDFEGRFTLELFETVCDKYGMDKLDFNDDGSCKTVEEPSTVPNKRKFGDVAAMSLPPTTQATKEKDVSYWRKYYGIKSKG